MIKEIYLECGSIVLVDDEDYEFITNCYDLKLNNGGYVDCQIKSKFRYKQMGLYSGLTLHKLLMNPDGIGRDIVVDHRDGNKLNNCKSNLRICTHQENMQNRKIQDIYADKQVSSQYKGVSWNDTHKKWYAIIGEDGGLKFIGGFSNEIAAANAYNYHAKLDFGEFALLNDVPYMTPEEWMKYRYGKNKTSKYIGVSLNKDNGKYKAQIWDGLKKTNIQLGEYETEEEAALAYNKKAKELKGKKAKLNTLHN